MCRPENVVGTIKSGKGEYTVVIVGVYSPGMETSEIERDVFWECFNECINGFSENERIVVFGDMNAKVGNREVYRVVGKYGVPRVNENG